MSPEQLVQIWKATGLLNAAQILAPLSLGLQDLTLGKPAAQVTDDERAWSVATAAFVISSSLMLPTKNVSKDAAIAVFTATLPTFVIIALNTVVFPKAQSTIGKINCVGCFVFNLGALAWLHSL